MNLILNSHDSRIYNGQEFMLWSILWSQLRLLCEEASYTMKISKVTGTNFYNNILYQMWKGRRKEC